MIGRLRGRVTDLTPADVIVDAGGVGYLLHISLRTFYALSERRDREAVVHVHTHVREDALVLFGFEDAAEREMFRHLIAVSGVGPRVALAVLSGIEPDDLRAAVAERDRDRLQRIPGVGKKTAERILLDLGDRLRRADRDEEAKSGRRAEPGRGSRSRIRSEAVSALVNLGYAGSVAEGAVDGALAELDEPERAELERVLREALRRLVR